MSNLKKNLSYNFILSLSQLIFPLLSIPYISRVLDPEGIGKVSFIDSFTWYFISLAEFGIATYGVRECAKKKNDPGALSRLISELLLFHIITSSLTLIVYFACIALVWHKVNDVRLLLFSLSFFLVSFFSCEWYYMGVEKFRFITTRSILVRMLGIASIFVLIKQPRDYYIYYAIMAGSGVITMAWNIINLTREVPVSFRSLSIRQHLKPAFVLFQITVFLSASIWLDNVLLGILGSAAALAYYAFAIKLVRITGALITDTLRVLYPHMVSLLQGEDHAAFRSVNLSSIRMVIALTIPLGAGLFIVAEPFTELYLGTKFMRVSTHIKILCMYPLLKSYTLNLSRQVLLPYHHDRVVVRGLAAGFASLVIFMLLLCPFLKDIGASISVILAESVTLAWFAVFIRSHHREMELFDAKHFLQAVAGSLAFVPVAYLVYRLPWPLMYQVLLIIAASMVIYFLFQWLVFRNKLFIEAYRSVRKLV